MTICSTLVVLLIVWYIGRAGPNRLPENGVLNVSKSHGNDQEWWEMNRILNLTSQIDDVRQNVVLSDSDNITVSTTAPMPVSMASTALSTIGTSSREVTDSPTPTTGERPVSSSSIMGSSTSRTPMSTPLPTSAPMSTPLVTSAPTSTPLATSAPSTSTVVTSSAVTTTQPTTTKITTPKASVSTTSTAFSISKSSTSVTTASVFGKSKKTKMPQEDATPDPHGGNSSWWMYPLIATLAALIALVLIVGAILIRQRQRKELIVSAAERFAPGKVITKAGDSKISRKSVKV